MSVTFVWHILTTIQWYTDHPCCSFLIYRRIGGFCSSCSVWSCVSCCGNMTNHQTKKNSRPCLIKWHRSRKRQGSVAATPVLLLNRDVIRSSVYLQGPVGALSSSSSSLSFCSFYLSLRRTIKQLQISFEVFMLVLRRYLFLHSLI